jgi:predicted esterase
MIVENSPLSIQSLAPLLMPWLKPFLHIPLLLREKWDANLSIPSIPKDLPFLGLAGERDEIALPSQMVGIKKLREEAGGRVTWKTFKDGTHSESIDPARPTALTDGS